MYGNNYRETENNNERGLGGFEYLTAEQKE